jgi:hypothetical protein
MHDGTERLDEQGQGTINVSFTPQQLQSGLLFGEACGQESLYDSETKEV